MLAANLTEDGDKLVGTATLSYLGSAEGMTSDILTKIAKLNFAAADKTGSAAVKLTGVKVAGYDEAGEAVYFTTDITASEAITAIGSKYDVNADGKVDLLDIVYAQKYYQQNSTSDGWSKVKH